MCLHCYFFQYNVISLQCVRPIMNPRNTLVPELYVSAEKVTEKKLPIIDELVTLCFALPPDIDTHVCKGVRLWVDVLYV